MKQAIIAVAIIAMVGTTAFASGDGESGQRDGDRDYTNGKTGRIERHLEEANVSEAQIEQVRAIYDDYLERTNDLRDQLRLARVEVANMMDDDTRDMTALEQNIRNSLQLRGDLQIQYLQIQEEVRAVVGEDVWDDLRHKGKRHWGGNDSKYGGDDDDDDYDDDDDDYQRHGRRGRSGRHL